MCYLILKVTREICMSFDLPNNARCYIIRGRVNMSRMREVVMSGDERFAIITRVMIKLLEGQM